MYNQAKEKPPKLKQDVLQIDIDTWHFTIFKDEFSRAGASHAELVQLVTSGESRHPLQRREVKCNSNEDKCTYMYMCIVTDTSRQYTEEPLKKLIVDSKLFFLSEHINGRVHMTKQCHVFLIEHGAQVDPHVTMPG